MLTPQEIFEVASICVCAIAGAALVGKTVTTAIAMFSKKHTQKKKPKRPSPSLTEQILSVQLPEKFNDLETGP